MARAAGASLIGTVAAPIKLKTIDGDEIDLAGIYGKKAVYLKFWATWCVPCREQMPHLEKTFERIGRDMEVVAVDVGFNESIADIRTYREQLKLRMPIVVDDGRLAAAFHLRVTPQHIVIGRDGKILYIGHLVNEDLEKALAAAAAAPAWKPSAKEAAVKVAAHPEKDANAGDLVVHTLEGELLQLADPGKARATVIAFVSPWCESYLQKSRPARSAACRQQRLATEEFVRAHPNARVIGIASGLWASTDDVKQYKAENHISIPIAVDETGAIFRRFDVSEVPAFVSVDASGRIGRRATRIVQLEAINP